MLPTLPDRRPFDDRRRFLAASTGAVAALWWGRRGWGQTRLASDAVVAGKHPGLLVHTATPVQMETPLALLRQHALTPKDILFIRNNQNLKGGQTLASRPLAGWKLTVSGLVEFPRTVDAAMLQTLPLVEIEMVLQCSGNGRRYFSQAAKVSGEPWDRGAVGNVRFGGVPLKLFLERIDCRIDPRAAFLTAEGLDEPHKPTDADFEHSLPLADVLERSLLAWKLNGEPLPQAHGGPVRLVTPGYYGTMHVKWISRLRLEAAETSNHNQLPRYRTPLAPIPPGTPYRFTVANSEPNWRMKVKSQVFTPLPGERLSASEDAEVSGVAWNDGLAPLEAVLVSTDRGQSWRPAALTLSQSPYAWSTWRLRVRLPKGRQQIWARAVDALGRTQPLDGVIHWNPQGYTWNGVEKIEVEVA